MQEISGDIRSSQQTSLTFINQYQLIKIDLMSTAMLFQQTKNIYEYPSPNMTLLGRNLLKYFPFRKLSPQTIACPSYFNNIPCINKH